MRHFLCKLKTHTHNLWFIVNCFAEHLNIHWTFHKMFQMIFLQMRKIAQAWTLNKLSKSQHSKLNKLVLQGKAFAHTALKIETLIFYPIIHIGIKIQLILINSRIKWNFIGKMKIKASCRKDTVIVGTKSINCNIFSPLGALKIKWCPV